MSNEFYSELHLESIFELEVYFNLDLIIITESIRMITNK